MPLVLSWSVLFGWSVIRLVTRFASTRSVTEALLMGVTAGYLHIGLDAVMGVLIGRFASSLDRQSQER